MSVDIGKAKHGRKGFTKYKHFYLKSEFDKGGNKGGNNYFRVIPPIKSLAKDQQGRYSVFYSVHKGLVGSDGKQRFFLCPEEYDWKTKTIIRHCPLCDKAADLTKLLKNLENQGVSTEKLNEQRRANIEPLQAQKRYYINAINLENEIGSLELPIRSHKALKDIADAYDAKGVDIMDLNGLFLNFKKVSAYKGDNQVLYPVEVYRETIRKDDGSIDEKVKTHLMTPELINRLEAEAPDLLKDMFSEISIEDIAALAESKGDDRKKLIDKIFSSGQKEEPKDPMMEATIPGTNATAVGRMDLDSGLEVKMPNVGALQQPQAQQPAAQAPAPSAGTARPTPPPAATSTRTPSDEEIDRIFGN